MNSMLSITLLMAVVFSLVFSAIMAGLTVIMAKPLRLKLLRKSERRHDNGGTFYDVVVMHKRGSYEKSISKNIGRHLVEKRTYEVKGVAWADKTLTLFGPWSEVPEIP